MGFKRWRDKRYAMMLLISCSVVVAHAAQTPPSSQYIFTDAASCTRGAYSNTVSFDASLAAHAGETACIADVSGTAFLVADAIGRGGASGHNVAVSCFRQASGRYGERRITQSTLLWYIWKMIRRLGGAWWTRRGLSEGCKTARLA